MPRHHVDSGQITGAALALETRDVRRGSSSVSIAAKASHVDGETGNLIIDRGDVVETLANSEDGVEQSWTFAAAPVGDGTLTVHVAVAGHPFLGETPSGLHFGTPGNLGFRYGHATWIDADGVATALKARWESDHIAIDVPPQILAASAYPAVLDPVISAEVAVDNPVTGWSGQASVRSAIASSGTGFLAVWSDSRNGAATDIFGARLNASGAVLDPIGIAIAKDALVQDNPQVAFIGGEYVVVWDNGTTVDAARVSTMGAIVQLGTVGVGTLPKIGARTTDGLVAFVAGGNVQAAVFSGGNFGAPFAVSSGGAANTPAVAGNPAGDYLVTWSEGAVSADLLGRFVTAAGATPGAAFNISAAAGGQRDADTAFNGTDFITVWSNNNAGTDLYGTLVSTAGVVLNTRTEGMATVGGIPLSVAAGIQEQPAVACSTGSCLISWTDRRAQPTNLTDIYAQRVDSALALVGTELAVAALASHQRSPAIAVQGTTWRLSWHDTRHGGTDTIFSAGVNADGSLPNGSGTNIVTGNNREQRPTIKASTNNWLVAWSDSRVLGNDIMGVRFSSAGAKMDGTAKTISNASGQQGNPALTFDGTNYLAVWNDTRNGAQDVFAARMSMVGTLLDAGGLAISTATGDQLRPAAATGGGVSLVVWQDERSGSDIYGALVNASGAVVANDIAICAGTGAQADPAVAYDSVSGLFLVVWDDARSGNSDIYGARVTAGGVVQEACGVPIASGAASSLEPRVTAGGGQFYVTWTDRRNDANGDIYGSRVNAASGISVLDGGGSGIAIAAGASAQVEPDVAFILPSLYFVVWTENGNINGQTVRINGTLEGTNFVVSAGTDTETGAVVTAGPNGKPAMVAYERLRPDLNNMRVVTRQVSFSGSIATACTMDSQCSSGFCVDGYCCDAACGGNNQNDCQACAVYRGAQTNGICSVITNTQYICRLYADVTCDVTERCNGVDATCPPDLGRRQGGTCTLSSGGTGTCPAVDATGSPHVCMPL
ncbi:MAG: hypothetical protein AB7R00_18125 [Kofleriaceae bacterium]